MSTIASAVKDTVTGVTETQKIKDLRADTVDLQGERMRTDHGTAIADPENWLRVVDENKTGPSLLEDQIAREKIQRFDHERIPERVVHARGAGAHGYFEVTDNCLAKYTTANVLTDTSRKTPVFVRFSTVQGSRGSADTVRDVRGFATKFYTPEGNWDLVGNNIPVFFIQDAIQFPDFVHAVKPEPHNEVPQGQTAHNNFWDFSQSQSQTTHMLFWAMSDRGIPRSFRMMQGFGVNTYTLINADGQRVFVKFHWIPDLGVHSLTWDEALKLAGQDPDFHRKDLEEAIENGAHPKWTFSVQIVEEAREHDFDFDILDATKIWPEELVPLQVVGEMVLNRTVTEFFPETEQVAFCTSHVVPGIGFSDDPLLQGRNFSYFDTQISRLGINWEELPINRPVCPVMNFNRDGQGRHKIVGSKVNYHPNRLKAVLPTPTKDGGYAEFRQTISSIKQRARSAKFQEHFHQAQLFYNSLTEYERDHTIAAFSFELSHCDDDGVYERMITRLSDVDFDLAKQVALNVGAPVPNPRRSNLGKKSDYLSQFDVNKMLTTKLNKEPTIISRRIAILVADGVDVGIVQWLKKTIKEEGAFPWIIAPRRGAIYGAEPTASKDEGVHADHHFEGQRSTMFDAVIIPPGSNFEILASNGNGRVVHWVREAFGHLKAIGAIGNGVSFLKTTVGLPAGIEVAPAGDSAEVVNSYGVVTTWSLTGRSKGLLPVKGDTFLSTFVSELRRHRNWDREKEGYARRVAF